MSSNQQAQQQQEGTFKQPEQSSINNTTAEQQIIASGTESDSPTFTPPKMEDVKPAVQPAALQNQPSPQVQGILSEAREIIINISKDHYTKILQNLKEDRLVFQFIDDNGKIQEDKRSYVPMTFGQNSKVGKVLKRERLFREDVRAFIAKEEGALDLEGLKKKYNDILESDVDEYDLKNTNSLEEIIGNYSVAQKAQIYWGIKNIENYSLNHMVVIQSLFESRNGFSPSS